MPRPVASLSLCGLLVAATASAQTIQAPFNLAYSFTDLGTIASVPGSYGGITFKYDDPQVLLLGGGANAPGGAIYAVPVTRNATGRVTGFGTATLYATAPNIDGGLAYGPGNVLFFTGYPTHQLGQIRPGSTAPDRMIALGPLGIAGSVGACTITPAGYPSPGSLRLASFNSGDWHTATLQPDGNGTFDVTNVSGPVQIGGGPEGLLFVPPGSPLIPDYQYLLVTEYGRAAIAIYHLDATGSPIPSSRLVFMDGLGGVEGACIDPITGDFFFSTYGSNRIISVQGFGVCGSFNVYGAGSPGTGGVPQISGGGCAGRGQQARIQVAGLALASGLLFGGFQRTNTPLLNFTVLAEPYSVFFHTLDGSGNFVLPTQLPVYPFLSGTNLYFQAVYLDSGAPQGVSATQGLNIQVR